MNFVGIVPGSTKVAPHHAFDAVPFKVRPGKRPWVEEHFPNIAGERVPIPDAEMIELVPAEEKAFEMGRRYKMVGLGQPLGHALAVTGFCFEVGVGETPRAVPA